MPDLEKMHSFPIIGADIQEFNRHNPITLKDGSFEKWTGNKIISGDQSFDVLKNISLDIERGEFLSIMGPSGSGKSTLLYLMGGLDQVTKGTICVNGIEMKSLDESAESRMLGKRIIRLKDGEIIQ
jgi:ABC-type lipoprotein export system ATPase subunit